uniref:IS91 family-like transposase n=1 Tax=Klebsiella pneumoniae TaxID=573 RepID=A0A3P8MLL9_KLEPN|nr:IS91 family-like transposase [Klebsiella pneumoniae]
MASCPTGNGANCCQKCMRLCRWRRGNKRSSRASPRKGFLHTDPNKCLLYGNRLRFSGA